MRIFPEKKHRHQSLIKPVASLIVVSILLSLMISNDNLRKAVSQEQGKLVITETSTLSSESFPLENAAVIETMVLKATSKQASIQELLDAEGGVVAYSKGGFFILINTNKKTVARISRSFVDEDTYTGDLGSNKIETSDYTYWFSHEKGIKELNERYRHTARHKKTIQYQKVRVGSAESAIEKVEHWYDYYNEKFKGHLTVLGAYEQNKNNADGHEPITWIVLHSEGNKTLLVSSLILARGDYNHSEGQSMACSWKSSRIRKWLNTEFYDEAFSDNEKKHILSTLIEQDGETSKDKVILLNREQVNNYFREQQLTQTAAAGTESVSGSKMMIDWWLISSGDKFYKYYVTDKGGIDYEYACEVKGIRPAIWVDSSSIAIQ